MSSIVSERHDIAVVWTQFGPHHVDRCEALAARVKDHGEVHGIEIASQSEIYAWEDSGVGRQFRKHTLYPGQIFQRTSAVSRVFKLLAICTRLGTKKIFVCNYNHGDIFFFSLAMRIAGSRVYLMLDSKFDDKPRLWWREAAKTLLLVPYKGALVSGQRSKAYLRFLGFKRPICTGYDSVDVDRILELGGGVQAPEGAAFSERHFVLIARFVTKKNIEHAIASYARYRELAGAAAREFHICGSGPLETAIRTQIADLGLDGVVLHGFLQREGVARVLSTALALTVPSVEEQWGLVVNEALAFSLPILATDQVGARDLLIRTGVNGYIFEPGNVEGLAQLMYRIGRDEAEWRRLVAGSQELRHAADAKRFVEGVLTLLGAWEPDAGHTSGARRASGS